MPKLTIAIIQTSLTWEEPGQNLATFTDRIAQLPEVDLIILPETFTTGFSMNYVPTAGLMEQTMDWLNAWSEKTDAAICGSFITQENGKRYNRFYFITPDGDMETYDKRQLFSIGNEASNFTAGTQTPIIEYRRWKIKPQICYDLRFPEMARNREGYDLLLYVANWPEKRIAHWSKLLEARAIENQCYVAGCNRIGEDGHGIAHNGQSAVIDFMGNQLANAGSEDKDLIVTISKEPMQDWREKFPVLKDMKV